MKHQSMCSVRLDLTILENRITPTLMHGIDLGVLADVLTLLPDEAYLPRMQRMKPHFDIEVVVAPETAQTGRVSVTGARMQEPTQPNYEPRPILSPALSPQQRVGQLKAGNREVLRTTLTKSAVMPSNVIRNMELKGAIFQAFPSQSSGSSLNGDVNSRAAHWSTYDANGTTRADGVNDIAVGVGACADHTIAVGAQGRVGTIRTYAPSGALMASQFVPPSPGGRSRLTSVAVHPVFGAIYATGQHSSAAGTLLESFIAKWDCLGGATPTAIFRLDPSAGNPNRGLREIAIQPGAPSGLDVTAVGDGDYGGGYTSIDVVHVDAALTTATQVGFDFGTETKGHAVAIDDGAGALGIGTRYVGGGYHEGNESYALNFALRDDDVTIDYAWIWSAGTPSLRESVGFYGMTQVGPHLYMNGTLTDSALNPAIAPDSLDYENNVVAKALTVDGASLEYGWVYFVTGGDYTSRAGDVTAAAELVTAGSIDTYLVGGDAQSLTVGDASQFDSFGNLIAVRDSGDCDGTLNKDTDNSGIAVHANGDISVGGTTNAGRPSFEAGLCPAGNPPQILNGADSIFSNGVQDEGPPADGYLYRDKNPIGT